MSGPLNLRHSVLSAVYGREILFVPLTCSSAARSGEAVLSGAPGGCRAGTGGRGAAGRLPGSGSCRARRGRRQRLPGRRRRGHGRASAPSAAAGGLAGAVVRDGQARDQVPGPGAIASVLRTGLASAPFNTRSVPIDVGYSDHIPQAIRRAVIARAGHWGLVSSSLSPRADPLSVGQGCPRPAAGGKPRRVATPLTPVARAPCRSVR